MMYNFDVSSIYYKIRIYYVIIRNTRIYYVINEIAILRLMMRRIIRSALLPKRSTMRPQLRLNVVVSESIMYLFPSRRLVKNEKLYRIRR